MKLKQQITNWLKSYYNLHNLNAFVVGISGGIDSAVTSTLCAKTNKKTIVITMPINQNPEETDRGKKHISWLKETFRISSIFIRKCSGLP